MNYLFKNINQFVKRSKVIFAVFAICEITSFMLMIFSFGIYQNYSQQVKDMASNELIDNESDWLKFDFTTDIDSDNPVSNETVILFLSEMEKTIGDKIGSVDFDSQNYHFALSNNNGWEMYDMGQNFKVSGMWYSGRYFNKSDYDNASKVCVAPIECYKEIDNELGYDDYRSPKDYDYQAYDKNGKIYVDLPEGTFEVVGFSKEGFDEYYIPYTVLPLNAKITSLPIIQIKQILYRDEYNSALNIYKKYFKEHIISDDKSNMPVYDTEVMKTFQAKMTICVIIAIISSINIAALFKFVIEIRRRQMSIFRINGCTKNQLRRMMITEMMFYSIVNAVICISIFHFLILPELVEILPYIKLAYTLKGYIILILVYIAVTYIIQNAMIFFSISRSPIQMLKRRR